MCLRASVDNGNGCHLAAHTAESPCESQLLILTTFTITQGNLILTSSHFSPLYSYTMYINNKYTLLQYYCFVNRFILGGTVIINPGTDSSWGLFLAQWKHCPRPAKEHWLWVIIWVEMFRHPGAISCPLTAA